MTQLLATVPTSAGAPANPIAPTSRWMAAARAREHERADRLFDDPLAADLAGPEGFAWLDRMQAVARSDGPGLYPVIRTRFFDDFVLEACRQSPRQQVVLVAAGLDTRAFRLDWPSETQLYELDLPEVLDAKEQVLQAGGARPRCERRTVEVDLRDPAWADALVERGYEPDRPSVWLIEGLLYYLRRPAVDGLLGTVRPLIATDSLLGLDVMNRGLFFSPAAFPMRIALSQRGAPGRFGTNNPELLMTRHGFEPGVTQPGEAGANFGRWSKPRLPRTVPGIPRSFFVRARRS